MRSQRKEGRISLSQRNIALFTDLAPSRGSMSGFLRQRNRDLVELPWQLIQVICETHKYTCIHSNPLQWIVNYIHCTLQIADTPTPGQFTMWVIVGRDLHQMKLMIPRVFYVNSHTTREIGGEGTAWRCVSKSLPRAAPSINLYEYSVPEMIFQDYAGYVDRYRVTYIRTSLFMLFSELATQLSSPDIEGVYESNVPLVFRAVVSMGCVCTINRDYVKMVLNGVRSIYK